MKYRTFGKLGWQVSEIGFGAWALGGQAWGGQSDDGFRRRPAAGAGPRLQFHRHGARLRRRPQRTGYREISQGPQRRTHLCGDENSAAVPGPGRRHLMTASKTGIPKITCANGSKPACATSRPTALTCCSFTPGRGPGTGSPAALEVLRKLREGKLLGIGISTPEQDQNSLVELMRNGWLDGVQVFTIFSSRNRRRKFCRRPGVRRRRHRPGRL